MIFVLFIAVVALFVRVVTMGASMRALQQRLDALDARAPQLSQDAPIAAPRPSYSSPPPMPATESSFGDVDAPDVVRLARERPAWTTFVAEHALSLVGGAFVLIAAVLFLTYAINAGWINETLRTALAAAVAFVFAGAAARIAGQLPLHERLGRAIGSLHGVLAGVAAAIAAADVIVASRRYDVLDTTTAFVGMLVIGVVTLATAVRWRSQDLAAFGIVGMLGAAIFVDAPPSIATLALVAVALLVSIAAVVMMDWPRLALVAIALTAPQLSAWAGVQHPTRDLAAVLSVTAAWWLVITAAVVVPALAHVQRARRTSVIGACVAVSFAAYVIFEYWVAHATDGTSQRGIVVGIFACVHIAFGLWLLARKRAELVGLAAAVISTGAALAAISLFASVGDSARACSLVAEAVGVSSLWWIARSRIAAASSTALGMLALAQVINQVPDTDSVWVYRPGWELLVAPIAVLVGALVARRLSQLRPVNSLLSMPLSAAGDGLIEPVRRSLTVLAWVTGWYLGFLVIIQLLTPHHATDSARPGMLTLAAWTFALALVVLDRAMRSQREEMFALASIGAVIVPLTLAGWLGDVATTSLLFAGASIVLALAGYRRTSHIAWTIATGWMLLLGALSVVGYDGSPAHMLARGVQHPGATLPLLAWLLAILVMSSQITLRGGYPAPVITWARRAGAVVGVYLVSGCVVRAFTNPPGHVHQEAQVALSVTWALLGLAALAVSIAGPRLVRSAVSLRIGAYVLLGIAAFKVLILDTSQLETPARIGVFFAVGLLLLIGARLEQVLRSRVA